MPAKIPAAPALPTALLRRLPLGKFRCYSGGEAARPLQALPPLPVGASGAFHSGAYQWDWYAPEWNAPLCPAMADSTFSSNGPFDPQKRYATRGSCKRPPEPPRKKHTSLRGAKSGLARERSQRQLLHPPGSRSPPGHCDSKWHRIEQTRYEAQLELHRRNWRSD